MPDRDCVGFLQWCLPRLGLRWPGYRKVRRTVCKRVGRRRLAGEFRQRRIRNGDLDRPSLIFVGRIVERAIDGYGRAQALGQGMHVLEAPRAAPIEPVPDLLCAERLFAERRHLRFVIFPEGHLGGLCPPFP
ncbi:MAG: hypothetical protein IH786_10185 [Proteobacteria bacterium]|nr:hypothetical protein [Pseudomonadota bacterium]